MQNDRLPKTIFVLLAAVALIYFWSFYSRLPEVVASHFDGQGRPNGWQIKSAFFYVFMGATALAAFLVFGVPALIKALPVQLINLPNKQYWLGPGQRAATFEFLGSGFAWFGCAVFLVILFAFNYALQSNLHPDHPPAPAGMWYALLAFLVFTMVWTSRLILRFVRTPQDSSIPK